MGDFWAALYILGLVLPGLTLVVSAIVVGRLAQRRRALGRTSRPVWHFVALHFVVGVGLAIPFVPAAVVSWLLVPGYLYVTQRRSGEAALPPIGLPLTSASARRRSWGLAVLFSMTGLVLPWATGLGVKMYLDSLGRPTLPIEGFIDPASMAVEALLTLGAWAFPFLVLASAVVVPWRIGFTADTPARDSLLPIWLAYAAGVAAAIPVFVAVFWEFDALVLLLPVGLALLPPMALAYLFGWWMLRRRYGKRGSPRPPISPLAPTSS